MPSLMKFKDDEFVKNNSYFVQLENYPTPRPINEVLAAYNEDNEDDDSAETMESIKSAEKTLGAKMEAPKFHESAAQIRATGTIVDSPVGDNFRIYASEIEEGSTPKDEEKPKVDPK